MKPVQFYSSVVVAEINYKLHAIGVRVLRNTVSVGDLFDYVIEREAYGQWENANYKAYARFPPITPLSAIFLKVHKIEAYRKTFSQLNEGYTCYLYVEGILDSFILNNVLVCSGARL